MLIDCDDCTARGDGCADCVVTALLGSVPAPGLPEETVAALGILADGGLLPPLRLVAGTGSEGRPPGEPPRFPQNEKPSRHATPPLAAGS
jgi:hypothetical protein